VRRVALVALVAAAAALAPAAAATTKPSVGRLWHAFPLGHTRLAHSPQPRPHPKPPAPRPQPKPTTRPGTRTSATRRHAATPHGTGTGILTAALAGSATAITVIGLIVFGRRRGWTGRPAEAESTPERRAGTAPRVIAFYAVAAAIGVIVGLLIPLVA
jgi:hypothetical protein